MKCSVEGCTFPIRAKGMCKNHRQRFLKYGRIEKIMTGEKASHPLYIMWNKRRQKKNAFSWEWLDFNTFIEAVGEKPDDHFLARPDETLPCGPANWEWRKIKLKKLEGETSSQYSSRHSKLARSLDPDHGRKQNYKYNYGLTLEEVNAKLDAQNHVCCICKEPEGAIDFRTGKIRTLALDHNHKTKKNRDFLCTRCNNVLGRVEENIEILSNMILYLRRHEN